MKTRTGIACWNVRALLESSRLNQAAREINAYNIFISGLSEARWNGFGVLPTLRVMPFSKHQFCTELMSDWRSLQS
jgi:hypothetical protein